jgi:RNA polymerase sigma-70 factor (sigma-E family)
VADHDAEFSSYVVHKERDLRRLATALCGDWSRAQDFAQVALVKLYVAWPRLRDRTAIDGYVRKILLRAIIDDSRRLWSRKEALVYDVPSQAVADPCVATAMIVRQALMSLPVRQRAAVVLRVYEQLTVQQTAELLRCSEGTVKSQVSRGLARLREIFVELEFEGGGRG